MSRKLDQSTRRYINMPGSDYSRQWNEARDGGEVDSFIDKLEEELEEELDTEQIRKKLNQRIRDLDDS